MERDEAGPRVVADADIEDGNAVTLGVTVNGGEARFWYVRNGQRIAIGGPLDFSKALRRPRLEASLHRFDGRHPCGGSGGRGVLGGLRGIPAHLRVTEDGRRRVRSSA
ncbi:hypothetical protein QFZ66_000015 [Streptomyces sp. B4I13]|uniref:hypothetical protein n=1 Tax=Streptomyces sp. B4I13 TaxID=3042271 RepID=UPI002781EEFC|nr:hypothetical protein [Streptomyces sp. B4I13]MDQ0956137.1 hypothetical protein [Streptomyces sp. B4I13]